MRFAAPITAIFLSTTTVFAAQPREVNFRMEWIPSGMYAPFYLAVNSGEFEKNGLQVNMLSGNGGLAAIDEVTAGHADMGMASCGGLAIAIERAGPWYL